jgi:hypothetical protein
MNIYIEKERERERVDGGQTLLRFLDDLRG